MKKFISLLIASVMLLATVAGCSSSGSGTATTAPGKDSGSTTTSNSSENNGGDSKGGEFEVAVGSTEASQTALLEKVFSTFVEDYNSKNGTSYSLKLTGSQSKDIINTRMSSKDRPDILVLDSPADVAQYTKDDLLLDLSSYATEYKWEDTMFDWAYALSKVNGKVYALPYGYEGIVLWYNKAIMEELGLKAEAIKDLASFEAALKAAQEAGYTPIMLGTQDWPWAQEWYMSVMFSYTSRELLRNTLLGENDAKWTDKGFADTVNLYKKWHDTGYLADGKSYILTSDDAINAFTSDRALFKLEGTWAPYWITPLDQEVKDNIGVMLHPAINNEESAHIPMAVGGMWAVSADTAAPDLAGYVISQLLSADIQADFVKEGLDVAPIELDPSTFDGIDPSIQDMWKLLNSSLANQNYGYTTYAFYPPKTRVYVYEGIVNVLEGKTSVEDYLAKLQSLNDEERAAGLVPVLP